MTRPIQRSVILLVLFAASSACAPSGLARTSVASAAVAGKRWADSPDRYFTSGNARIRFRDVGTGEPVVLIHGYAGSLGWGILADSLASHSRVIALDLRGFGSSTKSGDPSWYRNEMALDVVRLMDHLGVKRAHLIGFSMGAVIAARIAQDLPQRVATLTLVAGAFWPDSIIAAQALLPWATGLETGRRLIPIFRYLYPLMSDSAAVATSDAVMMQNDSSSLVAVLRSLPMMMVAPTGGRGAQALIPTVIIGGSEDPLLPYSRRLAEWWPDARLVEIQGGTHGSVLSHPLLLRNVRSITTTR